MYRHESGTALSEWTFDAQGELAGVVVTSDTGGYCDGGLSYRGYSKVAVYGSPCEATGEGEDQCAAGGQGGAGGQVGAAGSGGA